jgi:hypothetical protein
MAGGPRRAEASVEVPYHVLICHRGPDRTTQTGGRGGLLGQFTVPSKNFTIGTTNYFF